MNLCLDTDAVIELIRARRPHYRKRLLQARADGAVLHISAISFHELAFGARISARPDFQMTQLERFVAPLTVVGWSVEDAAAAADLRAYLRGRGTPIGTMDVLIAGQARSRGWSLVTANVREFARVPGLQIIDWSDPSDVRTYLA